MQVKWDLTIARDFCFYSGEMSWPKCFNISCGMFDITCSVNAQSDNRDGLMQTHFDEY